MAIYSRRSRRKRLVVQTLEPRHLLAGDAAGVLEGTVWFDQNQDGIWDPDEPGLPGVIVYLDQNGNGIRDEDEPFVVTRFDDPATPGIDEAGAFRFTDLPEGEYRLAIELPEGTDLTFPQGEVTATDVIVNGSFEETAAGVDFVGWQDGSNDPNRFWMQLGEGEQGFSFQDINLEPTSPQDGEFVAFHTFSASTIPTVYTMEQQVLLGEGDAAELKFKSRIQWNHQSTLFPNGVFEEPHTFEVVILDPSDQSVLATYLLFETDITPGNREGDTGWVDYQIDLSQFLGQEIVVQFRCEAPTLNAGPARFELDAIELLVQTATPPPTFYDVSLADGQQVGDLNFGLFVPQGLNPPPTISAPVSVTLEEDTSFSFSTGGDYAILLDAATGSEDPRLEISVDVGTLHLGSLEGITLLAGSAEGDAYLLLEGSAQALQGAIDGLTFVPPDDYHGQATLSIELDDRNTDLLPGPQSIRHTILLEVTPVNDPPIVAQPIDPISLARGTEAVWVDLSELFYDVDVETSGDQLTLAITSNTNPQLVATLLEVDQLQLSFDAALFGDAEIEITATDLEGASASFTLLVTMREDFDVNLTLTRPDQAGLPGTVVETIPRELLRFHEWEPVTAELWFTPYQLDAGQVVQITIDLDFDPLLYDPSDIAVVDGAVLEVVQQSGEDRTWLEITVSQWQVPVLLPGDSVLLATVLLNPAAEHPVGVGMSGLTAPPAATTEVGIQLGGASIERELLSPQPLTVGPLEQAELLPVIYDLDDDGRIGLSDFVQFIASYGQAATPDNSAALATDFTQSGMVGLADFVVFIQHFGLRKGDHPLIHFPEALAAPPAEDPPGEGGSLLEGEPQWIVESDTSATSAAMWPVTLNGSPIAYSPAADDTTAASNASFPEHPEDWDSSATWESLDLLWAAAAEDGTAILQPGDEEEIGLEWSTELSLTLELREEESDSEIS